MEIQVINGDCLEVMRGMPADSVDTVCTDPPYGLGFMGKAWDHGVPGPVYWEEALRVAKPGAYLLAFGGTRKFHRLACAIEDAGWQLVDCMLWLYGSGFPKGKGIGKGIDKAAGAEREVVGTKRNGLCMNGNLNDDGWDQAGAGEAGKHIPITAPATPEATRWDGWNTALKPAWEPVVVAMKKPAGTFAKNALEHGVAGFWIDGCRIATAPKDAEAMKRCNTPGSGQMRGRDPVQTSRGQSGSDGAAKPLDTSRGRWPANVVHDGSPEVLAGFPKTKTGGPGITKENHNGHTLSGPASSRTRHTVGYSDDGSASRFFYCAKASQAERNAGCLALYWQRLKGGDVAPITREQWELLEDEDRGQGNMHPTVKPLELMRWLVRLTKTPTGGVVLDPFCGSWTTLLAAKLEGRGAIGIDLDPGHCQVARKRTDAGLL